MRRNDSTVLPLIVIGLFVVMVVFGIVSFFHTSTATDCVVNGKDRVSVSNGDGGSRSEVRIYTDNCGTMMMKDTMFRGVFNSADMYGSVREGETYDVSTYGFRIPVLSQFPVITDITPAS